MRTSRIPALEQNTFEGMRSWFVEMAKRKLLFHPEDAPKDIIAVETGRRVFTPQECAELDCIMQKMFLAHGGDVIDACYSVFMRAGGFVVGDEFLEAPVNG